MESHSIFMVLFAMMKILRFCKHLVVFAVLCHGLLVSAGSFDIFLDFSGSTVAPTADELAAFSAAEAEWESRIVDLKEDPGDKTLDISIDLDNIDGVGGTLGSAGPTAVKWVTGGDYLYAGLGTITLDTSDTANMASNGTLNDVILHEMAHVIGFGTLWSSSGVGFSGYQELYVSGSGQYTGAAALAAYQQEFVGQESATYVPVELEGGAGTADGHWNEGYGGAATGILDHFGRDMNLMLMSGWANPGSFISATTMGQWEDLGYIIVAIPEPSTLLMIGLSFFLFVRRRV